ncbi:MAG: NAD-dependent epimerase/dehydratase family protein [Sumerlaeia bacterium]
MNILVTGAAGFIGYHLCEALLAEGHRVVGVDSFNDYYAPLLKTRRHAQLEGRDGYRGVKLDVAEYEPLRALVRDESIELICHLAAQAGVRYSLENPFAYQQANLQGFLNILETCRHEGIERLVYASSSSVYGGNEKLPFSETDDVGRPVSLYAATKRSNELMAHCYTHLYKFQTVGLRFFTVYGPWGRPDMAYWLFTEAISDGRPISVFNHGKMMRDFTYVDDIVAGVKASLFAGSLDRHEILNLGNHQSEPLPELIEAIAAELGVEPVMEYKPMQPGDVPATYADIDRAKSKLGFEPKTRLRDGIRAFIDWYKTHPEIATAVKESRHPAGTGAAS